MIQRAHQIESQPAQLAADRLIFWKRDLPTILGVSCRTIDRWIATKEFPEADVTVHGKPVWRRQTIQAWCGVKGA
jgi:predicted DNA-binding transcriptional regulator AlpA